MSPTHSISTKPTPIYILGFKPKDTQNKILLVFHN